MSEPNCIAATKIKNRIVSGDIAHTYVYSYDNGDVFIVKRVLSKKSNYSGFTAIFTRFGHTLLQQQIAFKNETFGLINYIHNNHLTKTT